MTVGHFCCMDDIEIDGCDMRRPIFAPMLSIMATFWLSPDQRTVGQWCHMSGWDIFLEDIGDYPGWGHRREGSGQKFIYFYLSFFMNSGSMREIKKKIELQTSWFRGERLLLLFYFHVWGFLGFSGVVHIVRWETPDHWWRWQTSHSVDLRGLLWSVLVDTSL